MDSMSDLQTRLTDIKTPELPHWVRSLLSFLLYTESECLRRTERRLSPIPVVWVSQPALSASLPLCGDQREAVLKQPAPCPHNTAPWSCLHWASRRFSCTALLILLTYCIAGIPSESSCQSPGPPGPLHLNLFTQASPSWWVYSLSHLFRVTLNKTFSPCCKFL